MKEESKIFKEWYELNFEELPSPLEVEWPAKNGALFNRIVVRQKVRIRNDRI